jgi:membrane protein implicated in regulation of membrane protease activity
MNALVRRARQQHMNAMSDPVNMQALFLVVFVAGLVLNVVFVIRGTERWSGAEVGRRLDAFGREVQLGRISLRTPVIASIASAFGLTGYLIDRFASLPLWSTLTFAALGSVAAVTTAVLLVRRWAVPHALRDIPDARYILQGQLATVTQEIPLRGEGEVSYQIDDRRFSMRAQSLDGSAIDRDTDVVIERLEDGVVFVEDWARVEQRL